jgi:hypothetical protein
VIGTVKMLVRARKFDRQIGRQGWRDERSDWFSSDRRRDVGPQPRLVSDQSRYEGFL